jgi:hypothetical protein
MTSSFSIRPKPANNNAKIAFAIVLFFAAVAFTFYFLMDRYKGIVGTVGLFILVTAILIYTKYISPSFSYDVCPDADDVPVFIVRQVIGKRITTLCRIELADIASVKRETRAEYRAHKTPRDYKKYVYAPTLFPSEVYRLTVPSRYERAEIVIEISDELAELFRSLIVEANALRGEAEDE